jgi:hypothetical protein
MSREQTTGDAGGHCPACGAEYRSGFDVCSDCGLPLEPGALGRAEGPREMTDAQYASALADLRARPESYVALATLPWVEAWSTANDLWRAGIEAVFVPRDDQIAPADPVADDADVAEDVDGDEEDEAADHAEGTGWDDWTWGPDTGDDGPPDAADDQPPPGLERVRGGSVQPWLRPNQPPVAGAVLCVRVEDEAEARRVAGRRLGVL